jgi:cyclic-di-GMP-binding protein
MFDWISSGKSDHPLADGKSERAAFADLPADIFKALDEMGHWLDALQGDEALKLARMVEIVDRVDHAARGLLRKLQSDYIAGGGRLQRFQENRMRTAAAGFWKQLADAHALILRRFQAGAPGWGAAKAGIPLVVARGMRALTMRLKWQLLHYGPVDSDVWTGLGRFMAYAEQKDIASVAVTVYPGSESTIQSEFLKAAMLAISSTDSLLPRRLDIAERLIAHFSNHYVMQRQPAKGCHFYVDLGANAMPARFVERIEIGPGVRFFGPGDAAQALAAHAGSLRKSGAVPAGMDLGGPQDAAEVSEVLDHLARYWGPQPPARSGERRRSVQQIDVVHGYDEILARLGGGETEDLDFEDTAETWTVENESEGGYGAVLRQSRGDWLKVGTLVGVRLSDGAAWGVGIVRRLSARDADQRHVGLQLLARGAAVVKLRSAGAVGAAQDALLLPSSITDSVVNGELSLLLREGSFSREASLEMLAYERSYLLVPRALVEGGHDFDMARFRVLQRAA